MSPRLQRVYVWEFPVRLFHWVNVLCLFTLAGTGLLIGSPLALMNSGEAWASYWFGWLRFIHFTAAYLLLANLLFRLYWAWAGNSYARWNEYLPVTGRAWRDLVKTLRVYFWIDRWTQSANAGHNRLQGLTYLILALLTLFMVFTGFGMYSAMSAAWIPKLFAWVVPLMGGDLVVRRWHHMALWVFVVFLVIHIYMSSLEDRQDRQGTVSSIITGWKVITKR